VHRFTVLVETGTPGLIPQTAPVGLFLETDDIGNVGAFFLG
jgi:hypothetical protein